MPPINRNAIWYSLKKPEMSEILSAAMPRPRVGRGYAQARHKAAERPKHQCSINAKQPQRPNRYRDYKPYHNALDQKINGHESARKWVGGQRAQRKPML
jgi:hypothetical protein